MCYKWHALCPITYILNGTICHIWYAVTGYNWLSPGQVMCSASSCIIRNIHFAWPYVIIYLFCILFLDSKAAKRIGQVLLSVFGWEINSQCRTGTFHNEILTGFSGRFVCANSCSPFGKVAETKCQVSVLPIYRYFWEHCNKTQPRGATSPRPQTWAVYRISYPLGKILFSLVFQCHWGPLQTDF